MNIVKHPHHDLLAEANREREVSESPEAEALLDALMDAARAYWDFLERNHLIYEDDTNVEYACRLDGSAADVPVSPRSQSHRTRRYGHALRHDRCHTQRRRPRSHLREWPKSRSGWSRSRRHTAQAAQR